MKPVNRRSRAYREPNEVFTSLVAASVELISARDAALSAVLDVPPPFVEPVNPPARAITASLSANMKGLAYRGARSVYRSLKRVKTLQPVLEKLRDKLRRRF